jgi:predicted glycosyltransferase
MNSGSVGVEIAGQRPIFKRINSTMLSDRPRVLIYSHDSFGLGHLRRCRAIAHSLVARHPDLSVLILSGSPIIGSFDFRARVDFVRVPGVIKLRNGEYTPLSLHIDIEHTLAIRASIIEHTARIFKPDIFLVDKEPLGLRGEAVPTLELLRDAGTTLILGLRDVMDDPDTLRDEWDRKNVYPALRELYDEIWIYGLPNIHDPLAGLPTGRDIRDKTLFTGYLRRTVPKNSRRVELFPFKRGEYLMVTPGGGGDGVELVEWVFSAYEARSTDLPPAVMVLGPFMNPDNQTDFLTRAEALDNVHVIRFTPHIEEVMNGARAIVAMGGYNTFCEILSFDKPTLLVPRVVPRQEQAIRAAHAQSANLVSVLPIDGYPEIDLMIEKLHHLLTMPPPSAAGFSGLLNGLDVINRRVDHILTGQTDLFGPHTASVHTG